MSLFILFIIRSIKIECSKTYSIRAETFIVAYPRLPKEIALFLLVTLPLFSVLERAHITARHLHQVGEATIRGSTPPTLHQNSLRWVDTGRATHLARWER